MNPSPGTNPAQTPDEQVAVAIAHELSRIDLIDPSDFAHIRQGLADGTLRAEGWRLIAKRALVREGAL